MRKLFTLSAALLLAATLWAQPPQKMSYQAVIRNASNGLVANQQVGMRISILQGSADGTAVYTETLTPTTNANGLVSVEVGGGAGFDAINWRTGPYFLKTETDPAGGASYTITATSQLLSVPYAQHARTSDRVTGGIDEADPLFTAWDKSIGITINESQVSDLKPYLTEESDPVYSASVASGITAADTASWSGKLTAESDPLFTAWDKSTGIAITESQVSDLKPYLTAEADPIFEAWDKSSGITITENQVSDLQEYATKDMQNEGITNLADPVNAQDAVTKAYVDLLEEKVNLLTWVIEDVENRGLVNDTEGNQYKTIKIGGQIWMAENLRTTKYNDGTPIPTGLSNTEWSETADGAYAVYPHSSIWGFSDAEVLEAYGALYNWYAVETGNLCPTGWHVPTDVEWTTLTDYVGDGIAAVGKLKSTRTSPDAHPRWNSPNEGASDELGFSALPGGFRWNSGAFGNVGSFGYWWSSTEVDATDAWVRSIRFNHGTVYNNSNKKRNGFSVRCLRDL